MVPPVVFESVEFQPPGGTVKHRVRGWIAPMYLLVLGIWSVAATWHRHLLLGVTAGLVYLEFGLALTRAAKFRGGTVFSDELAKRIAPPVVELSARAGCNPPRVMIRDDSVRAACVRAVGRAPLLVVSQPFIERVDDRQLRAIVAHEIIHIVRRDLRWAKLRAGVSVLVGGAAGGVIAASNHVAAVPLYFALFMVSLVPVQALLAFLNRPLERRADTDGALLAADPSGLASALRVAQQLTEEARTKIYGAGPWRWLLAPVSWRLPTHPPMASRIATLENLAHVQL